MDLKLEFSFEARVLVSDSVLIGETPIGTQYMIPIIGGTFEGPDLKGTVLPIGADFLLDRRDGVSEVKATYTIETDDGHKIYVDNRGYYFAPKEVLDLLDRGEKVDPSLIYFRTTPIFRASAGKYSWLNRTIMVCAGEELRASSTIRLQFYKVK
ncbi:DUF3237 domain-containing protein [Neobacillus drentensis]|uniref:DUF3237 domain-containing protein n=1 Tax=Neobacillus drentensis TaxID=220684 RepID=UPI001F2CE997|nr:DUF3237 domain-containing protein [Neobacillus drentensis]ULT58678.1 DUF3237 domain-containing protein [Neobacillus drentensis]